MPLFRDRPMRSTVAVILALAMGYFGTNLISTIHALHMTQTMIAILAITSLMFLVTMHHRHDGQFMSQTQEEAVLIIGFALFWAATLLAWRAMTNSSANSGGAGAVGMREPGFTGSRRWGCHKDDVYCVVEEWSHF